VKVASEEAGKSMSNGLGAVRPIEATSVPDRVMTELRRSILSGDLGPGQTFSLRDIAGQLLGFLVGFISPDDPEVGYVKMIGTNPNRRRHGLGAELYRRFFDDVAGLEGATVLMGRCLPYGDGITFWPIVEMVRQLRGEAFAAQQRCDEFPGGGVVVWNDDLGRRFTRDRLQDVLNAAGAPCWKPDPPSTGTCQVGASS